MILEKLEYIKYFLPANYGINTKKKDIESDSLDYVMNLGSTTFKNDYELFGYLSVKHKNFSFLFVP